MDTIENNEDVSRTKERYTVLQIQILEVEGELGDLGHTEWFDFYEEQQEVLKPLVNRVLSIT